MDKITEGFRRINKNKEKRKERVVFKFIVSLVILLNVAFTAAVLYVFLI